MNIIMNFLKKRKMTEVDFSKLDLAFMLDTTSSMGSYINHAKKNITNICDEIIKSEKCTLRVGLVNYRDHPPQDSTYVTQVNQFTDDILKVKCTLTATTAQGGGDCPESMCCAFSDCLEKLEWRSDAVKVAILIADAPPHGLGCVGDSMPNGCPIKNDPVEIAHKMAQKGITLYCAGCEPALNAYRQFFLALCLITGGQYVSLEDAANLSNLIVGGTREEISMEKMMAEVHNDLMREAAEKGTRIDEEELTKRLNTDIEITDTTKQLSQVTSLEQMKQFATDHNLKLINDPYFFSKSTFSVKSLSLPSSALSLGKKKVVKKPLIKKTTSRKPKLKSVPKNKSRSRVAGCRLRRSKRIKEIEERKKKTMLIKDDNSPNFESKKTTTFKRKKSEQLNNSQSESDKDQSEKENIVEINNKKSKKESSPPEIVAPKSTIADEDNDVADVPSEKEEFIDIDRARRLAKKKF
ncbi:Alpha- kinase vwkA [Brachionus plicatilis]|uniref:Alpha-kinase vwkA n=1 Tax=Brachionus plicatilis TaxID=10195 RepID=A0A3M7RPI8_BRAPC|nr:Alpha- kinase vwkA [Brachionus plicatilis]